MPSLRRLLDGLRLKPEAYAIDRVAPASDIAQSRVGSIRLPTPNRMQTRRPQGHVGDDTGGHARRDADTGDVRGIEMHWPIF